jgi:HPt (histidine-containing phosphotransfer) domain-containing protein
VVISSRPEPIISTLLDKEPDLREIVVNFANRLPGRITEIRKSYEQQDFSRLKLLAHDLKGSGGNIGYHILTEICSKIEQALANNNVQEIGQLIQQLEHVNLQIQIGLE